MIRPLSWALLGIAAVVLFPSASPGLAATTGIPPCTLIEAAGATPTPVPTNRIIDIFGHTNGRNPGPIVVAPGGTVWIGESGRVAHITSSGDYLEMSIPFPYADGLAASRNGDLWIASSQSNAIARMSLKGAFKVYDIPRNTLGPQEIIVTPNGVVAFGQEGAIGQWTSAGGFKFFDLPDKTSSASSIISGRDGSLWLAAGSSKIYRLMTAGKVIEYAIAQPNAQVMSLGIGAHGEIWFTDAGTKRIGQIPLNGAPTELPLTLHSPPHALAIGRDGQVWFSEPDDGALGKIDATGTLAEYQLGLVIQDLAAAADGTLWLTGNGDKIVKIDRTGSIARFSTFTGEFCK